MLGWDPNVREFVSDLYYGKDDLELAANHARRRLADGQAGEVLAAITLTTDPESACNVVLTHLLDMEETAKAAVPD